ncbi:MAG: hypothetical protein HOO96_18945 [Polyangiaceae bacterium]|nr:hypothetical protein [Polyangiaceae bacterium]
MRTVVHSTIVVALLLGCGGRVDEEAPGRPSDTGPAAIPPTPVPAPLAPKCEQVDLVAGRATLRVQGNAGDRPRLGPSVMLPDGGFVQLFYLGASLWQLYLPAGHDLGAPLPPAVRVAARATGVMTASMTAQANGRLTLVYAAGVEGPRIVRELAPGKASASDDPEGSAPLAGLSGSAWPAQLTWNGELGFASFNGLEGTVGFIRDGRYASDTVLRDLYWNKIPYAGHPTAAGDGFVFMYDAVGPTPIGTSYVWTGAYELSSDGKISAAHDLGFPPLWAQKHPFVAWLTHPEGGATLVVRQIPDQAAGSGSLLALDVSPAFTLGPASVLASDLSRAAVPVNAARIGGTPVAVFGTRDPSDANHARGWSVAFGGAKPAVRELPVAAPRYPLDRETTSDLESRVAGNERGGYLTFSESDGTLVVLRAACTQAPTR